MKAINPGIFVTTSILLILTWGIQSTLAQTSETSRVIDNSGLWSTNNLFQGISAVGQPYATGLTTGTDLLNYSGFLNSFTLFTNLDTDADGIIDENDPDDDNDTLTDVDELTGVSFDPVTATHPTLADSDGDGASDGHEAAAGTNPLDPDHSLRIERIRYEGGNVILTWQSREGKSYDVFRGTNDTTLTMFPEFLLSVLAGPGSGPWKRTLSGSTNNTIHNMEWYKIRLIP